MQSNYWLVPESSSNDSDGGFGDSDKGHNKLPGGATGHAKAVVGGYSNTRKESNSNSGVRKSSSSTILAQQSGSSTPGRGDQSPRGDREGGGGGRSRSPSKSAINGGPEGSPHGAAAKRKSTANAGRRSTTNATGLMVQLPLEMAFNQAMELRAKAILSACMLIGFVDFLADGDLNYLSVEDRRDWTRHILKAVKVRDATRRPSSYSAHSLISFHQYPPT